MGKHRGWSNVQLRVPDDAEIAGAFIDAMNRCDHEEAAQLLSEDAEIALPGGVLHGRQAWLDSRRRQPPPDQLTEAVEVDGVSQTTDSTDVSGRLVQRWRETGEVANEMPVRIALVIDGGLIRRLELKPER
jgi:hypothetical protein